MNDIEKKITEINQKIEKNNIDFELNLSLARLYEENGDFLNAVMVYAYIGQFAQNKSEYICKVTECIYKAGSQNKKNIKKALEAISYISSPINSFPEYYNFYFDKEGKLKFKNDLFIFKFLQYNTKEYGQFVCLYNNSYIGSKYNLATVLKDSFRGDMHYNLKCEIINSKISKNEEFDYADCIVPIASTIGNQKIFFDYLSETKNYYVKNFKTFEAPYEFKYYRCSSATKISSDNNFVFGKPVQLKHSKKRKKLILDIFVDTLSFKYLKQNSFCDIRCINNFFKEGIIFTDNYSVGEYTRPVVSGIRCGCYTYKTGMFNDRVNTKISKNKKLLAEVLKEQGYITSEFSGDTGQPSGNLFRGMDRVIIQNGHDYRVAEIVEDVIEHLESFKDGDNYVRMSILDIHRAIEENVTKRISTETNVHLNHRFEKGNGSNSVFQRSSFEKRTEYKKSVRKVDTHLSLLFSYILENYSEEEFLITLSSDHGAMLLDDDEFLLKDIHTNTALMIRGAGIDKKSFYSDELTSVIDLYGIITNFSYKDKLINKGDLDFNIPFVLGGIERQYVISESLYPNQTYKICIRNKKYEYRLETKELTKYDGTINLDSYSSIIFIRNTDKIIKDQALEKYFFEIVQKHVQLGRSLWSLN